MWKLPATFALFPVLSPQVRPHVIKVFPTPLSTFDGAYIRKIPGLHNFNVHIPERGILGTRLGGTQEQTLSA